MGDEYFKVLKAKIYKDTGFDFSRYKIRPLKRRIAVRMRANKVKTYEDYIKLLNSKADEYEKLFEALTVNVTEFFRNRETFDAIESSVLPRIFQSKNEKNESLLKVWSAGCSSGEEAYSIAIMIVECLKNLPGYRFQLKIYATDLDKKSILKAKNGIYDELSLKGCPSQYIKKYFSINHKYKISNTIKNIVEFRCEDLFYDDPDLRNLDLILCRNVLIYFTKDFQNDLFCEFYEKLKTGGYVILGKVEGMLGDVRKLFQPVNVKERIYQKL